MLFHSLMNEELFQPHGLYAMIMTYKPDCTLENVNMNPDGTMEKPSQSDIEANTLSSVAARAIGDRSKYRSASGKTMGEVALPESCPLIFPALEAAPDEKKQNSQPTIKGETRCLVLALLHQSVTN